MKNNNKKRSQNLFSGSKWIGINRWLLPSIFSLSLINSGNNLIHADQDSQKSETTAATSNTANTLNEESNSISNDIVQNESTSEKSSKNQSTSESQSTIDNQANLIQSDPSKTSTDVLESQNKISKDSRSTSAAPKISTTSDATSKVQNYQSNVTVNFSISVNANDKATYLKKGNQIVTHSNGIDFSTVALLPSTDNTFFSLSVDEKNSNIIISILRDVTYTTSSPLHADITFRPKDDYSGQEQTYSVDTAFIDASNSITVPLKSFKMRVLNQHTTWYGVGPSVSGNQKWLGISGFKQGSSLKHDNYLGSNDEQSSSTYSFSQNGMLVNSKIWNNVSNFTNLKVHYVSSFQIDQSTLQIYLDNDIVTSGYTVVWDQDSKGFTITFAEYNGLENGIGNGSNHKLYGLNFFVKTNTINDTPIVTASLESAYDTVTQHDLDVTNHTDSSGWQVSTSSTQRLEYRLSDGGKFIPSLDTKNVKISNQTHNFDLKKLIVSATDQIDGDLFNQVIVKDTDGFNSKNPLPGKYIIIFSLTNSANNTVIKQSTLNVLQATEIKFTFVDDDNHGKNIHSPLTIKGIDGQTQKVNINDLLEIPQNYLLNSNQQSAFTVQFNKMNQTIVIHFIHRHQYFSPVESGLTTEQKILFRNVPTNFDIKNQNETIYWGIDTDLVTKTTKYTPYTTIDGLKVAKAYTSFSFNVPQNYIIQLENGTTLNGSPAYIKGTSVNVRDKKPNSITIKALFLKSSRPTSSKNGQIILNYLDQNSGKILQTEILTGRIGEQIPFDIMQQVLLLQKDGWLFISDNIQIGLTFTNQTRIFTINLRKSPLSRLDQNQPNNFGLKRRPPLRSLNHRSNQDYEQNHQAYVQNPPSRTRRDSLNASKTKPKARDKKNHNPRFNHFDATPPVTIDKDVKNYYRPNSNSLVPITQLGTFFISLSGRTNFGKTDQKSFENDSNLN